MDRAKAEAATRAFAKAMGRRRRRTKAMDGTHRQRCIDYYAQHSARELAEMLVDLEWSEGFEPATE